MDLKDIEDIRYVPPTLTAIDQFGGLLDIMEQFIREATQQDEQENHE